MPRYVSFRLEKADITAFASDVVVLKFARSFHGADSQVALALNAVGIPLESIQPELERISIVETRGSIAAQQAMFVGVESLVFFDYRQIRAFALLAMRSLAVNAPKAQHITLTIHGPGYGLDEVEAFLAEFEGILDALRTGDLPAGLQNITIVDCDAGRVKRLQTVLAKRLAKTSYALPTRDDEYMLEASSTQSNSPQGAAESFAADPTQSPPGRAGTIERQHAFVAMPFSTHMEDVYHFGIQGPVHAAGYLCERIDHVSFTGGIVDWIQQKIDTSAVVIAELTGSNPNVYLEVGYAWGRGRPTILLSSSLNELAFDVKGHRCLEYAGIKDLEEKLARELLELKLPRPV